jgi:hypothetical protein
MAAGNENQRVLITLVSNWLEHAGLETELLDYEFLKCAMLFHPSIILLRQFLLGGMLDGGHSA